jgi:predicted DCC family thiol-disulfide oxidoreductase YuxK
MIRFPLAHARDDGRSRAHPVNPNLKDIRVAKPPPKPLMVFDGNCNFCTLWIRRWQHATGDAVDYLPSQDPQIAAQFPEIPRERFDTAVQLIESDGSIHSAAEAVFRALAKNPKFQWPLRWYEDFQWLANLSEWSYRLVAEHRTFFSLLTRWFWGRHVEPASYSITRWLFLRALGAVFLVAFVSLWMQIRGLIGHDGILPTDRFMSAAKEQCESRGIGLERYYLLPTLCWFNASDHFLNLQCAAGTLLAALLIVGVAPVPCLALLWLLYLSLVVAGREFLSFQWDNLLLEAGFLAIFFAPLQLWPRALREAPPSRLVLWLLRLLLFKLMFSSGCVKLVSGDPAWRNLTALTFHYQTQPLPTWPGWYANLLPLWFQKFSCAAMFAIELGAPFFIFAPRRLRFIGAAALVFLQILIFVTGNYTFFNWLTLALCILLLDDFVYRRFFPGKLLAYLSFNHQLSTISLRRYVTVPLAVFVIAIYVVQLSFTLGLRPTWLYPVAVADARLGPFRTFNTYGLFAVMTTSRHEIIVEGSNDGENWLPYEFKYKPGDVKGRPGFVAPLQPRLDWQMWFAALGSYQGNPWFVQFCQRLLQGSPEVAALLAKNPFPDKPPKYIRAEVYDYHFTTAPERRASGAWWTRELIGEYLPPVSLREFH